MVTLRKRPNRDGKTFHWQINYREDGQRRQYSIPTDNEEIARRVKAGVEKRLSMKKLGLASNLRVHSQSLSEYAEEFLAHTLANKAPRTYDTYQRAFRHFTHLLGNPPIDQIARQDIERFKIHCRQTMQASTINILLRSLKAAFSQAVSWDLLEVSPFRGVKLLKVEPQRANFLDKGQVHELLSTISDMAFREVIRFVLLTGLRRQETMQLQWSDIDLKRGLLHVRGKGARLRIIPLNKESITLLQTRTNKKGFVFPELHQWQRHGDDNFSKRLTWYARKAGLRNCTLHTLRHTYASHLIMAGADLVSVRKLLGHSTIATTMIYSHLADEHLRKAAEMVTYT